MTIKPTRSDLAPGKLKLENDLSRTRFAEAERHYEGNLDEGDGGGRRRGGGRKSQRTSANFGEDLDLGKTREKIAEKPGESCARQH